MELANEKEKSQSDLCLNAEVMDEVKPGWSRESICAAQQRRGSGDGSGKNWKHGKCKGLIPYVRGGGGAAGGSGADFFFPPLGGAIYAAAAGLSQRKRGLNRFPPKSSQDVEKSR